MDKELVTTFPFAGAEISPMPEFGLIAMRLLQRRMKNGEPVAAGPLTALTPEDLENLIGHLKKAQTQYLAVSKGLGRDLDRKH